MNKTRLFEKLEEINRKTRKQTKKLSSNGTDEKTSVIFPLGWLFLTANKQSVAFHQWELKQTSEFRIKLCPIHTEKSYVLKTTV